MKKKYCPKCKKTKGISQFYTSKGIIAGYCKKCHIKLVCARQSIRIKTPGSKKYRNKKELEYRKKRRKWLEELKANIPCFDCSIIFPPVCMDWDHRDGKAKLFCLANGVSRHMSKKRILVEIAKCDLVCSNCHRIRTAKRGGYHER